MKLLHVYSLLCCLGLASCEPVKQGPETRSSIKGDYEGTDGAKFQYSARYIEGGDIEVRFTINNTKTIGLIVSPYEGLKELESKDVSLKADDIQLLKESIKFVKRSEKKGPLKEFLTIVMNYMSEAPVDYPLSNEKFQIEKDKSLGIKCLVKGRSYQATWSLNNSVGTGQLAIDDKFCFGRCGSGCIEGPSVWTRDCLDLDACRIAIGKTNSVLCADEWKKSADDWILGHLYGCQIK